MVKHSGLQREVLALYRKILRIAAEKDRSLRLVQAADDTASKHYLFVTVRKQKDSSTAYACQEFRRQASQVARNDFKRIEYMIRKGEKHLKLLKMPGVQTISGPSS